MDESDTDEDAAKKDDVAKKMDESDEDVVMDDVLH